MLLWLWVSCTSFADSVQQSLGGIGFADKGVRPGVQGWLAGFRLGAERDDAQTRA
jgi:hypothetical protein